MSASSSTVNPFPAAKAGGGNQYGKSPLLVGLTLGLWSTLLLLLGRDFVPILASASTLPQLIVLGSFSALLAIFWLLGIYYLAFVLVHFWSRKGMRAHTASPRTGMMDTPPVAILYPTCDDFQRDALLTYLAQDYPHFHVFILDDSRNKRFQEQADDFQKEFFEKVTVVRRIERTGFKAGNLNHALRGPAKEYPLFAVMDADERIPKDFLREMMARLINTDFAFAQANHAPNPAQTAVLAKLLGDTILPFWAVFLTTKNRFGFVSCMGHGVLVRRSAWECVGGFPEVASEDLAFSACLLAKGLRGTYAEEVLCYEDFPETLAAFQKQQVRYVAGVFQGLLRFWPKLMKTAKAPWLETLDFGLSCLPLYVPVLCFLFILIVGLGIPLCFGRLGTAVIDSSLGLWKIPYIQIYDGRFHSLWRPTFIYLSILFSLCPAFPMLSMALAGRIRRPLRLLIVSNLIYMATMLVSFFGLLKYVAGRSVQFVPTGGRIEGTATGQRTRNYSRLAAVCETTACLGICAVLLGCLNVGLAALAACPVLCRLSSKADHQIQVFSSLVFLGIICQIIFGIIGSHSGLGIPPLLFSIHF